MFQLLSLARAGSSVDLPDPRSILPYLKLFSLVTLNPKAVRGRRIAILHQPPLSILANSNFVPAPPGTPADAPNVARIFDVLALVNTEPQLTEASIPLTNKEHDFGQQRYWRLPVKCEAVLAALFQRLPLGSYTGDSQEIRYSLHVRDILSLQSRVETVILPELYVPQGNGLADAGGGEPGDGGEGGAPGDGGEGPGGGGGGAPGDGDEGMGGSAPGDGDEGAGGGIGDSGGVGEDSGSGPRGVRRKRHPSGDSTEPTRRSPRKKTVTSAGGETLREAPFYVSGGQLCYTWKAYLSQSFWIIDFSDSARSPPHGVHPPEWEVNSAFSTVNDTLLQLKAQNEIGDFVAGVEDEPGE